MPTFSYNEVILTIVLTKQLSFYELNSASHHDVNQKFNFFKYAPMPCLLMFP